MENCNNCITKNSCITCKPEYFLFDENQDDVYNKCVKCTSVTGCVDDSLIFDSFSPDGSGISKNIISRY